MENLIYASFGLFAGFIIAIIIFRKKLKKTVETLKQKHKEQCDILKQNIEMEKELEFVKKIVTVSDSFNPSEDRTPAQISQDAVMKLKNEISKSGCLSLKISPDGKIDVELKIVKL